MRRPTFKYYYSVDCPFSHRTSIILLELFSDDELLDFEFISVDLANKPDWFLRLNPIGQVPVLCRGDNVMVESLAICEYLLHITTGHGLLRTDPFETYKLRAFIERFTTVKFLFYRILRGKSIEDVNIARQLMLQTLTTVIVN